MGKVSSSIDSNLKQASQLAQSSTQNISSSVGAIAPATQQAMQGVGSSISSTFQQASSVAQSNNQAIASSFQTVSIGAAGVVPAITQIGATGQAALGAVSNAALKVPAAIVPIATVSQQAGGIIQEAGQKGAAAVDGLGKSAIVSGGIVGQLKDTIAANQSRIIDWSGAIADSRVRLATLGTEIKAATLAGQGNSESTQKLRAQFTELSAATTLLSARKAELSNQNKNLGSALSSAKDQSSLFGTSLGALTTRINTGRGVLQGYDAVIEGLARTMGGIPIVFAIAIQLVASLATVFTRGKKAAEDNVEITSEQIRKNILLADSYRLLANASPELKDSFEGLNQAGNKINELNLDALFIKYANATAKLKESTEASTKAQEGSLTLFQGLKVAGEAYLVGLVTNTNALGVNINSTTLANAAIETLSEAQLKGAESTIKNTQSLDQTVQALLEFNRTGDKSTQELIELGKRFISTSDSVSILTARLVEGSSTIRQLNADIANFKLPRFDTGPTPDILRQSAKEIANDIERLNLLQKSQGEIFTLVSPKIKAYNENLKQSISANAAASLKVKSHSEQQKEFQETLAQGPATVSEYSTKLKIYEQNQKNASETTKKASGVSRAAFNEFAAGIIGLDKAIKIVEPRLGDEGVFNKLNKNTKAGAQQTKAAFKEVADAIEEFFKAQGKNIEVTAERLQSLDKGTAIPLINITKGFKNLKDEIEKLNFNRAAGNIKGAVEDVEKGTTGLPLVSDKIKVVGNTFEIAAETFQRVSPKIIENLAKIGIKVKEVFPGTKQSIEGFIDTTNLGARALDAFKDETKISFDIFEKNTKRAFDEANKAAINWAGETAEAAEHLNEDLQVATAKAMLKIRNSVEDVIDTYFRLGEQAGKTNAQIIKETQDKLGQLPPAVRDIAQRTLNEFSDKLVRLPGIFDGIVNKLLNSLGKFNAVTRNKVKETFDDIFGIIDLLPGKIGDSLRKGQNEIERWVQIIDRILGIASKIFTKLPSGIDDALGKVVGIFNKTAQSASDLPGPVNKVNDILKSIGINLPKFGDQALAGAGKFAGAFSQIAAGASLIVGGISQGGFGGAVSGALGGLLAGAKIGSLFGPGPGTAIGAGIGAAAGFFAGLFGGGKSKAQKEAEARAVEQQKIQLEKLKQDLQKDAQEVVQTALTTIQKAMETLSQLADFTKIPKATIKAFFSNLNQVLQEFTVLAGKFGKDLLDKGKEFAEKIGPGIEAIGAGVVVLTALNTFIPVADRIVKEFFLNFESVVEEFGRLAEELPKKLVKSARAFAKALGPITDVLAPAVEGIRGLMDFKPVSAESIDNFALSFEIVIQKITEISGRIDKIGIKAAALFAERSTKVFELVKVATDALKSVGELAAPSSEAFDILFEGIKQAIERMQAISATITVDMLGRAEVIAQKSLAIFSAIKAAVEALTGLSEFKGVMKETWDILLTDFEYGITVLSQLVDLGKEFYDKALQFEDYLTKGAEGFRRAGEAFTSSVLGVQSVVTGAFGQEVRDSRSVGMVFPGSEETMLGVRAANPTGLRAAGSQTVINDNRLIINGMEIAADDPRGAEAKEALRKIFAPLKGSVIAST